MGLISFSHLVLALRSERANNGRTEILAHVMIIIVTFKCTAISLDIRPEIVPPQFSIEAKNPKTNPSYIICSGVDAAILAYTCTGISVNLAAL